MSVPVMYKKFSDMDAAIRLRLCNIFRSQCTSFNLIFSVTYKFSGHVHKFPVQKFMFSGCWMDAWSGGDFPFTLLDFRPKASLFPVAGGMGWLGSVWLEVQLDGVLASVLYIYYLSKRLFSLFKHSFCSNNRLNGRWLTIYNLTFSI